MARDVASRKCHVNQTCHQAAPWTLPWVGCCGVAPDESVPRHTTSFPAQHISFRHIYLFLDTTRTHWVLVITGSRVSRISREIRESREIVIERRNSTQDAPVHVHDRDTHATHTYTYESRPRSVRLPLGRRCRLLLGTLRLRPRVDEPLSLRGQLGPARTFAAPR